MRRSLALCRRRLAFYDKTVEEYASQQPHRLTVGDVLAQAAPGTMLEPIPSAQYVHSQLPIRLAQTIRTLQTLPFIVGVNPYINDVYYMYWDAFQVLQKFPQIYRRSHVEEFNDLLLYLLQKNRSQFQVLAKGISEVRAKERNKRVDSQYVDNFLDSFLKDALIRRLLVANHLAHTEADMHTDGQWQGIFRLDCLPAQSLQDTIATVKDMCVAEFGAAPKFEISGDVDTSFMYIPSHLDFVFMEMLKNSTRAVALRQQKEKRELGPIELICRRGDSVEVVIADEGGGLPPDQQKKIWMYGYTADNDPHQSFPASGQSYLTAVPGVSARLGGAGFGLPLARVYIRYLGGDIMMQSTLGYGSHCHLTFPPIKDGFLLT